MAQGLLPVLRFAAISCPGYLKVDSAPAWGKRRDESFEAPTTSDFSLPAGEIKFD